MHGRSLPNKSGHGSAWLPFQLINWLPWRCPPLARSRPLFPRQPARPFSAPLLPLPSLPSSPPQPLHPPAPRPPSCLPPPSPPPSPAPPIPPLRSSRWRPLACSRPPTRFRLPATPLRPTPHPSLWRPRGPFPRLLRLPALPPHRPATSAAPRPARRAPSKWPQHWLRARRLLPRGRAHSEGGAEAVFAGAQSRGRRRMGPQQQAAMVQAKRRVRAKTWRGRGRR